jgi:hypothetical protein
VVRASYRVLQAFYRPEEILVMPDDEASYRGSMPRSAAALQESNFPVDKQSCGYLELWNAFKLASRALSPGERDDLFYRTACRTYRLPELEAIALA